ncbi:MAG: glycosyltransferase [Phycisphaerales bacterium]|nr:MAG: glycosyltransferase [Phycisphaerales bacterium]
MSTTRPFAVLHFIEAIDLSHGGPVRAVLDLSRGLAERGHTQRIHTGRIDVNSAEFPDNSAITGAVLPTIVHPSMFRGFFGFRTQSSEIEHAIRSTDVVHFHNVWQPALPRLARLCRRMGTPYVISLRGMLDDWSMAQKSLKKRLYLGLAGTSTLERASAVHCTAQFELEQAQKWFPKGRGVVIPNLLDLNPFRSPPGPNPAQQKYPELLESRPKVLFLSRVHYKKGADVFVQAIAELTRRGIDVRGVVAGPGDPEYVRQLREQVRTSGIDDRILFTGHVNGDLKISLYQACEIFALPTHQENFGFVIPEALAAEAVVITTKGVDIWPELESSNAVVITDRTPAGFADAIESLVKDPPRLARMRENAKPFVFREFDESRTLDKFEHLYEQIILGKARSSS